MVVVVERRSGFWASCIIYLSVAESSTPPPRRLQEAERGCEAQFGESSRAVEALDSSSGLGLEPRDMSPLLVQRFDWPVGRERATETRRSASSGPFR
jgi:hypothetical protein